MESAIEILARVWDESEGVSLEVGDFPDAPSFLELRTHDKKGEEWFGKLNISMSPDYAIALGNALIMCGTKKKESK